MSTKTFLAVLVVFAGLVFAASSASAQMASDISIDVSPQNPGPNQLVNITLSSYALDLRSADIEWSVGGHSVEGGVGATSYGLITGNIGTTTTVSVIITPVNAASITRSFSLTPASVDILWQATDASVPPLYRGKALPTSESQLKFVAIPAIQSTAGTLIAANSLVYDWQENYENNQDASGYGKDSYLTTMDYLNPDKHLGVDVSTREGGGAARGSADISPYNPKLVWYASSPLYGPIFDTALSGAYNMSSTDASVFAEPYFFSPGSPTSSKLTYTWTVNDKEISTPFIPNQLFLQKDIATGGTADIGLTVTNVDHLFQEAVSSLTLYLN